MKNKGISLIVLTITIVIIVIISTTVILRVREENITDKAFEVVAKNNMVVLKEEVNNKIAKLKTDYASQNGKALRNENINISNEELQEIVPEIKKEDYAQDFKVSGGQLFYTGVDKKVEAVIKEVGKIETLYAEKKEDSKWNKPYVPSGYEIVKEDGKILNNVDEGFVIRCTTGTYTKGSEFVWVPVKSEDEYKRYIYLENSNKFNEFTEDNETKFLDCGGNETEAANQKASIVKYGGFYIGRYEASDTETQYNTWYKYPTSLKNKASVNYRPDSNGICGVVSNMTYPTLKVTLVTGHMFDITCKWLYENNSTINKNITYFNGGKSNTLYDNIGYFTVGDKILTGSNNKYSLNNIYDLSGNMEEVTYEMTDSVNYVIRGGGCTNNHKTALLSRSSIAKNVTYYGFRLALYI